MSALDPTPDFEPLETSTEYSPPEVYGDYLIEWALQQQASDLFISDDPEGVAIRIRRLGRLKLVNRLSRGYGSRLQNHLRVTAGLEPTMGVQTPAEGSTRLPLPGGQVVELRLSSMPTLFGQDLAMRIFDAAEQMRKLDQLGIGELAQQLKALLLRPSGLLLVAGPTGHGKTSTLYSCLDYLCDGSRKIHTLEDPVERIIPGVLQSQVDLHADADFHQLLQACLRNSPDVVMVGEIRDARTAQTAIRAGIGGQLVLATVHAKTAAEAVRTALAYDAHPQFLADALIGVIGQRLIRQLCPQCRRPLTIDRPIPLPDSVIQRMNGAAPQLFAPTGCDACGDDGFASQTAICEILETNHDMAMAIASGQSADRLQEIAVAAGMVPMVEQALMQVVRGETTAEEVRRVIANAEVSRLVRVIDENAQERDGI